ncbi:SRPBCC domain-containing protein [Asticcacaulis sp. 201]|uniref:SRPBCC family protein n=1 Tax=Asticcacaulis sp. 201 TaxID=3028787 RepID=UPI002915CDBB|nr:SRPBCC domain-containing protein [Asticcacaulis sp. 201]MDV6331578.1 SRPBCC domain-containing protein [Asticcacaulis sp. 201]
MPLETPYAEDEVFTLSRTFDASPALLWDVLTRAEHLAKWFGPVGMPLVVKSLDFTVGGTFLYGMQMPTGLTMWGKWVFRDIQAPKALAYVVSFCTEAGAPVRHPMAPLWPLEVLAVQTLTEKDGKTVYESRSYPINATPEERAVFKAGHASMQMGFSGTLAQLEAYLAQVQS